MRIKEANSFIKKTCFESISFSSKIGFFFLEAVAQRCSEKKVFLGNFARKHLRQSLLLTKLQT